MIDILKKLGIFGIITAALIVLGTGINNLVNWSWLVSLFKILRTIIIPLDFIIDTTELITALGVAFSVLILFWVARGSILVSNYFKNK